MTRNLGPAGHDALATFALEGLEALVAELLAQHLVLGAEVLLPARVRSLREQDVALPESIEALFAALRDLLLVLGAEVLSRIPRPRARQLGWPSVLEARPSCNGRPPPYPAGA